MTSSSTGEEIARSVAAASVGRRLVTHGRISQLHVTRTRDPNDFPPTLSYAVECALDDGTGVVWLLFPGRRHAPGIEIGTAIGAEGVVRARDGQMVIEDPFYRLEDTEGRGPENS